MAECSESTMLKLPDELLHSTLDNLSRADFSSLVRTCRKAYQFNGRLYNDNGVLFYAAKWNKPELAEKALEATYNVNRREPKLKMTALAMALDHGSTDVAMLILQHPDIDVSLKTNGVPLLATAAFRERKLWRMLSDRTKDINLNERWPDGDTPLIAAIKARNTELARFLLDSKADAFARDGFRNMMPLEHAARTGNVTIAKLLLQGNGKAQIENSPGVLAIAAESGSVEIAELCIAYASETDESEQSASTDESEHSASTDESEPYDDDCRWPHRGRRALVIAAEGGRADLVEWLLNRDEIQLNSIISEEALARAVLRNNGECVLTLLRSPKLSVADECLGGLHRKALKPLIYSHHHPPGYQSW